ncbi:MAG: hypothetical protein AAGJ35_15100 [Myxococcota bacterium]
MLKLRQRPLQLAVPLAQKAPHVPELQNKPLAQRLLHAPQCAALNCVSTQVPPQSV